FIQTKLLVYYFLVNCEKNLYFHYLAKTKIPTYLLKRKTLLEEWGFVSSGGGFTSSGDIQSFQVM
ncbi:MAG: hypothetical protein ACTSP3_10920, partial [Candidatus Heimdallarchaeaceae archaeon]